MKSKITTLMLLVSFWAKMVYAREAEEKEFKPTVIPYLKMQFWNVYSEGITSGEEVTAARVVSYFRRGRAGLKGNILPSFSYDLMLTFDYLGRDGNISTKGVANVGAIALWSFYFNWKAVENNDWLNITGGYFLPHMSRESATTPWSVSSLDKTETSCYLRQFATGKTNGVSPGINLGGLGKAGKQTLVYNIAFVNRQDLISIQKENWSPVFLGHLMLNFGDSEFQKYNYTISNNTLKKQTSATLGFGFSTQGRTDAFQSSSTIGADAMFYLGNLKIDGEYYKLLRTNETKYQATCTMVRTGYNIFLKNRWILEPTAMFELFSGDDNYTDASFFDGKDQIADLGINMISNKKKIKFGLHYILHNGDGIKNHYVSNETHPGNYVTFGIQITV